jgi:hypothetical protein
VDEGEITMATLANDTASSKDDFRSVNETARMTITALLEGDMKTIACYETARTTILALAGRHQSEIP